MALPRIGADAELRLDKWTSNVQKMMADASNIDSALLDLVGQANKTEAALNDISGDFDVNMAVTVDDGDIEGALSLKEMLEDPTSFVANVNDTDIDSAIGLQAGLDQNTFFTADVNDADIDSAKRKRDDLESNTSFRADVNDSELDSAKRKHDDLDQNVTTKVEVDDSEMDSLLSQIRNLQTIEVGISLAGGAAGLAGNVANATGLPGLFEMDDVLKDIEGTTGRIIPNLEQIINQLYSEAWGESRTQIGNIVAEASRLNISYDKLEDATRRAFALSDILGEEPEIILRAMDRMVDQGIVPDFATAADVITTTFQNGGNQAEDMMDTIIEYAPDFAALGLTGENIGGAIVGGIEAGFMNSDYVGDSFKELNIRLDEWARDRESHPIFEELGLWDQTVAFNAGTMSVEEYLRAIEEAISALPAEQQSAAFLEIFGTPAEQVADDWETFLNGAIEGFSGDWQGAMDKASAAVEGDIGTSFTSLKRTVEVEFGNLLNNVLDVDALIEDMRVRFSQFMGEITSGASFGEATESSFGGTIIGDIIDTIEAVEEAFMDMIIGIMQAVESVLRTIGENDEANALAETISQLAEFQLNADLFGAATYEEIANDLRTALQRGVDDAKIQDILLTQIDGLIQNGQVSDALNLLFEVGGNVFDEETLSGMVEQIRQIGGEAFTTAINAGDFQAALDAATAPTDFTTLKNAMATSFEDGFSQGRVTVEQLLTTWNLAEQISGSDGMQGLFDTFPEQAENILTLMEGLFNGAIASGNLDLAQRIADTTDIPAFQSKIDQMISAAESVEQPIDDTMQASEDATTDFTDTVGTSADDIDTSTEHVKGSYQTVETASGNAKKKVKDDAGDMSTDIDTLATDVGDSGALMETDFNDVATSVTQAAKTIDIESQNINKALELTGNQSDALAVMMDASMNAIVEDMSLLIDTTNIYAMAAQQAFMTAGDAYSLLAGRIAIDSGSIIDNLKQAQMQIAAISNVQINIPTAGGGGVTNNNQQSTTNVNITNNNNSQAAATASSNAAAQLLGH